MYQLCDFYDYCKQNRVDVIPYAGMPAGTLAMTMRQGRDYCVIVDLAAMGTVRALRTAVLHEEGHLRTGALYRPDSPYQVWAQCEQHANAEAFRCHLPAEELCAAMRQGFTEPWQLAEYFDLEETYIRECLRYWQENRGVDFNRLAAEGG